MITLSGSNLGERQKNLNEKVNEAVKCNINFDTLKNGATDTDVDILFKIDIAAKYKNINYISHTLKSGDNFYISRALKKCTWLGNDEFAIFINVKNLHDHIFPYMSLKMKKKLLCSLAMYISDEDRSISFFEYSMQSKLFNVGMKFLLKTPESYKEDVILKKSKAYTLLSNNDDYLYFFIGDSINLADTYLKSLEDLNSSRNDVLYKLRHLFSSSEAQYLALLEKYSFFENSYRRAFHLGSRISKEVMKSHKGNVLKNPLIYVNILNNNILSRMSTANDVKVYIAGLLPKGVNDFWQSNFYASYGFLLDVIPETERFSYMKHVFTNKYESEPFEENFNFYSYKLYNMMTTEEKQQWALEHFARGEELFGVGNDFKWYKFVNFDKAFEEMKKFVFITPDPDKRLDMLNVLIDSAKTQKDLETLLNYYYTRHVNEMKHRKQRFLDRLFKNHKVLNFNEECWTVLEKIFYSLDVFNKLNYNNCDSDYRVIALLYYIINRDTVLQVLNDFIDMDVIQMYQVKSLSSDLDADKKEKVFQYFLQFYIAKVQELSIKKIDDEIKKELHRYIDLCLILLKTFSKTKDSVPELMKSYIELDREAFKYHSFFRVEPISLKNIVGYLKTDAVRAIKEFSDIIKDKNGCGYQSYGYSNWLIQKLKTYFHHDIANQYLTLINESLSIDPLPADVASCSVRAIFYLANESFKIDFLEKHAPTSGKIDHAHISQNNLNIQRAICNQASFSRPILPLKNILCFIVGDYVPFCLPMFYSLLMNLPQPQSIMFVESLINKPISIQKHGLRLAFECFSPENLAHLINDIWMKTKNVSMRKIVYKALFDKVVEESDQAQSELFEVLRILTSDLHQDDDTEIFDLLSNNKMSSNLIGSYLVTAWQTVSKFSEKAVNFNRMADLVSSIEQHLRLMPVNVVIKITDDHISEMFDEKQIFYKDDKKKRLQNAKWSLTNRYLSFVDSEEQMQRNLDVIKRITKVIIEMWNEVHNGKYVMREFCSSFLIEDLEAKSYEVHAVDSYSNMNIMYATMLKMLHDSLPDRETYLLTWQIRLSDIARKIIITAKQELKNELGKEQVASAIRTSILRFAECFESLVKEFVKSGNYFASFHDPIQQCVTQKLDFINRKLDVFYLINFNTDQLEILMCTGLLKSEMPEMYIFILKVSPLNYSDDAENCTPKLEEDYENILKTVKIFKDDEVQYFMYNKFVLNDFQYRKHVS